MNEFTIEGVYAYDRGICRHDNPYAHGTDEHMFWDDGWEWGYRDDSNPHWGSL